MITLYDIFFSLGQTGILLTNIFAKKSKKKKINDQLFESTCIECKETLDMLSTFVDDVNETASEEIPVFEEILIGRKSFKGLTDNTMSSLVIEDDPDFELTNPFPPSPLNDLTTIN